MKRLKRYEKQIVALMSAFVVLVGGVLSTSFVARAEADRRLNMLCSEPIVDDNHGYILLECSSGSALLLHWVEINHDTGTNSNTTDSMVSVRVNPNSIEFKAGANGYGFFGLYAYLQTDAFEIGTENIEVTASYSNVYNYTFNWSDEFVAYTHGGEFQLVDNLGGWTHDNVIVTWGADTLILKELSNIHSSLALLSGSSNTANQKYAEILDKLNSINTNVSDVETILARTRDLVYSYLSSVDVELKGIANDIDKICKDYFPQILEEQRKTNNWLGKIWQSLQDFLGLQGEESTEELEGKEESEELTEKEDELLNDDTLNTDDLELDLDTNSSGTIWSMVDRLVQSNEKVFTALISILTLGIVALILNR